MLRGLVHGKECAIVSHHACLIDTSLVQSEVFGLTIDVGLNGLTVFVEAEEFFCYAILYH